MVLPYAPQPVFSVGAVRVRAFALFAVAAILVARWIVLRRGRRFGITYAEIAPLFLTVVLCGLAGAVVAGLFDARPALSSMGAVAGGLAGALACCGMRGCTWQETAAMLDVAAFAAPFAGAIGRLGCTVAHDHRGRPSDAWLAFGFPEGRRYDLGFVDFLFLVVLAAAFLALDRKRRPPLFFFGVAAVAYGAFRIWRGTLEVTPAAAPWMVLCAVGAAALVFARTRPIDNRPQVGNLPHVNAERCG